MNILSPTLGLLCFASEAALRQWRRSPSQEGGQDVDRGSLRLLWRVTLCAIAGAVLVSVWRIGPKLPSGVRWDGVGAGVWIVGAALRWWAIRHLGRFFTVNVAVVEGQRVVDDGPYRLVRHPSYTGLLLEFIGLGLSMDSLLGLAVLIFPILLVLLHRIQIEEIVLQANLGQPYASYSLRTKKLVPLIY